MHKLHHNKLPKLFYDNFVNLSSQHSYGTRRACSSNYYLPRMSKACSQNVLFIRVRNSGETVLMILKKCRGSPSKRDIRKS